MSARVCITGIGVCTPLGNSYETVAEALLAGQSGVRVVDRFDSTDHPSRIAAMVDAIPRTTTIDFANGASRTERALLWCCEQALRTAGFRNGHQGMRIGLVFGLGSEWLVEWEEAGVTPPSVRTHSALSSVAKQLGIRGPVLTLSAACASGNYSLAVARAWLRKGLVDVCLAGGADLAVTPITLATFGNLRALSRRNDDPIGASRPFDLDRDGFVLGEGAVALTLEREFDVRKSGGQPLAEIAGFGATSDAHHIVTPCPDHTAATQAIEKALADAQLNPDAIDYISAHGTGTPLGDICETRALQAALGTAASNIPASSIKSMTGHLLTASAAFEAVACLVSMERGIIAPTINLDRPDPECALNHVANRAIEQPVAIALSNSFGFGGSNTSLVLRKAA